MGDVPQSIGQTLGLGQLQEFAVSADGQMLAVPGKGGILLLDRATKEPIRKLTDQTGTEAYGPIVFSPDGTRLAVGRTDGTVVLWQLGKEGTR